MIYIAYYNYVVGRFYDIVKKQQDLGYLTWDECSCPSGLTGSRAKAREGIGAHAVFYKMSHSGALGHNCQDLFAELVSSRLMRILGIDCVPTQLVWASVSENEKPLWVIRSKSYREPGERGMGLSLFYELRGKAGESPLEFCQRMGWQEQIAHTALFDFISATRSRDDSCFEVLCSPKGAYRLAPCMPRGLSLANSFPKQTWRIFATADVSTDNYLGSSSLERNLSLVPASFALPPCNAALKKSLFAGLHDIVPDDEFLEATWQVISRRWHLFEDLRNL